MIFQPGLKKEKSGAVGENIAIFSPSLMGGGKL